MPRTRLAAEERRSLIVDAAFARLAREGFEGLRTRDVAMAVAINPATLHYYFPTKEALVAAVAERLEERLREEKRPRAGGPSDPRGELRQALADASFCVEQRPDLVAVYRELAVRAIRDPVTRVLVDRLDRGWQRSMEDILRRGRSDGVFQADLPIAATATAIVAALWGGIALLRLSGPALTRMTKQLERTVLSRGMR